jgi:hypothetical protein
MEGWQRLFQIEGDRLWQAICLTVKRCICVDSTRPLVFDVCRLDAEKRSVDRFIILDILSG